MGRGRNKIKSQRGASITFALLLFLVCAMASAVAIVSATVAGGQLKNIAETDQRYYAVNSAANLFKDTLDGKSVEIVQKTVKERTVGYKDGNPIPSTLVDWNDESKVKKVKDTLIINGTDPGIDSNLIEIIAHQLYDYDHSRPEDKNDSQFSLGMALNGSGDIKNKIDVNLQVKVSKADGTINIIISKSKSDTLAYKLTMVFMCKREPSTYVHVDEGPQINVTSDDRDYEVTETRTEEETSKYTWQLVGIKKG